MTEYLKVIESFDDFISYYDSKYKEKSYLTKGKYYSLDSKRFKTIFDKIWDTLGNFPDVDIKLYVDTLFDKAETTDECLPHRFFQKSYMEAYKYVASKERGDIQDVHYRHEAVLMELESFLKEMSSDEFKKLMSNVENSGNKH